MSVIFSGGRVIYLLNKLEFVFDGMYVVDGRLIGSWRKQETLGLYTIPQRSYTLYTPDRLQIYHTEDTNIESFI